MQHRYTWFWPFYPERLLRVGPGGLDVTVKHGAWEILIRSGVFKEVGLSSGGCRSGS